MQPEHLCIVLCISKRFVCPRVKPALGVVPAQDFQLVELRFTPQQSGMHRLALPVVFNNTDETTQTLALMGLGQTPQIRYHQHQPVQLHLRSMRTSFFQICLKVDFPRRLS